jgi:Na+/H+ antiporter NhaD/arsenite permease-like protein
MVLAGAIALFFLEDTFHLSPAFIALGAAAVGLVWVRPDVNEVLHRVEWGVLIFFGALFVMVGGLEASGALEGLVAVLDAIHIIPDILFGVVLIWFSAGLSAFVDNVPITIALIPVLQGLAAKGINVLPFWWALAFGAGFGGNGTIIGSTANIVVASLSERTRNPITPSLWNKRGLPIMLICCTVASLLYLLLYPIFTR